MQFEHTICKDRSDCIFAVHLFIKQSQNFREGFQTAAQDSVHLCNGDAVVDDGKTGFLRMSDAPVHFLFVEHTAAAVHAEFIPGQIFGKLAAGCEGVFWFRTGEFLNPRGHFHRADVTALTVVGASLGDEDSVPVLQLRQHSRAFHQFTEIPFVPCEQNGEGGQRNIGRCVFGNPSECLGVGDDEPGLFRKRSKSKDIL